MADNIVVKDANGVNRTIAMKDLAGVLINRYTPVNENNNMIGVDLLTRTLQIIDYSHHEVHSGSHYFICGETTLANAATLDFQLTTPNTDKWLHMTFEFENTQETLFQIYESADVDPDGAAVTAYNNNRNSLNTTDLTLLQTGGTVNTAGNLIYAQRTGIAGNPVRSRQGFAQRENEIILKQNTTYRFIFTSGGDANNLSFCGEWYEHTNKTD